MITWLNPGALVAVAAAALPVLVHLLLRSRAIRVLVPSVRFISSTRESAIRILRPSDVALLLVRMLIVACAALALAAPILITTSRTSHWMNRTIRAIVVDTSASVDAASAAEAATAESAGAFEVRRFEGPDVVDATQQAAAWLRAAPPGRQELVMISDFQHGAVSEAAFDSLPKETGIRTVTVRRRPAPVSLDGGTIQFGSRRYAQAIAIDARGTSYRLREVQQGPDGDFLKNASSSSDLGKLARTVAVAGIFIPRQPAVLAFSAPGSDAPEPAALFLGTPPGSLETAMQVHELLATRPDLAALQEAEPAAIDPSIVQSWHRDPGPPAPDAWRRTTESDARWFWLAAILLLGVETLMRRDRGPAAVDAAEAHAA